MKKNTLTFDVRAIKTSIQRAVSPIVKHSTVIVMVGAIGALIYSITTVSAIITPQEDPTYEQEQSANRISGKFDQATIDKINNLKASSDGSAIELPEGRRNPFTN